MRIALQRLQSAGSARRNGAGRWSVAPRRRDVRSRRGAATLDYVLLLGTLSTLGGVALYLGSKVIVLAYDMVCAFVAWPFM
jgi:hypothetical protein